MFVSRPFQMGDKWAVRVGKQLRLFVNSREAYEFWQDANDESEI